MSNHEWAEVNLGGSVIEMSRIAYSEGGTFVTFTGVDARTKAAELGGRLPTPEELDARWEQAEVQLDPSPGNVVTDTAENHTRRVMDQLHDKGDTGGIVAGVGKHWADHRTLFPLYGWHVPGGRGSWKGIPLHKPASSETTDQVIQPYQSRAHNGHHVDYSMTLVLTRLRAEDAPETLQDPTLPRVTHYGDSGADVKAWQSYLNAHGYSLTADGKHGPMTEAATDSWREDTEADTDPAPPPAHLRAPGGAERQRIFGPLEFKPQAGGVISITNDFAGRLVSVGIPQLQGIVGAPHSHRLLCHELVATPLIDLWRAWEREGLLPLVKTWSGMYCPRMIRGSSTTLSNHAFGTAFDVNAKWNWLGQTPAAEGEPGSVRELVHIAAFYGWAWGGHYSGRPDGMHFEHVGPR